MTRAGIMCCHGYEPNNFILMISWWQHLRKQIHILNPGCFMHIISPFSINPLSTIYSINICSNFGLGQVCVLSMTIRRAETMIHPYPPNIVWITSTHFVWLHTFLSSQITETLGDVPSTPLNLCISSNNKFLNFSRALV